MQVRQINNKKTWESLVKKSFWTPFFQSWNFGQAVEKTGNKVLRLAVFDEKDKFYLGAQVFFVKAKRGNFLHLRHAPFFQNFNKNAFLTLLQRLKKEAKKFNACFIRMSPLILKNDFLLGNQVFFKSLGFVDAPLHNQDAENCLVLDLAPSLKDIWLSFRKTTRNLISKAERLKVEIKKTENSKDLKVFLNLYQQTAKRQKFTPHKGIEQEYFELKKNNQIELFLGIFKGRVLSAALIVFYGSQAVYHHSASIPSKIPVNYLLQWEVIKEAKKKGFRFYNFWGIAPEGKSNHPWQGLTFFKKGFGGKRVDFIHAKDLPLSWFYPFSYFYQKLWNIWRGY